MPFTVDADGDQVTLVECTQDLYWASGLPLRITESTKPGFYPGRPI